MAQIRFEIETPCIGVAPAYWSNIVATGIALDLLKTGMLFTVDGIANGRTLYVVIDIKGRDWFGFKRKLARKAALAKAKELGLLIAEEGS